MARSSTGITTSASLHRAMAIVLSAVLLLTAVLVIHFLLTTYRKYGHIDITSYGMFWSRRELLWLHLAGGAIGMLLGPIQFITRLRGTYPRFHRWTGRTYLLAMLVACAGAAGLIATSPASLGIRVAFSATGLAWLFTALMGFAAIRKKQPLVHRRWMVRAYVVTLAPIAFRMAILIPGVMQLASPEVMIPTLLWLSWAAPLLAYEAGRRLLPNNAFKPMPLRGTA